METIEHALKEEGRAEGLAEGKGKSLMRLLERRFGPLPQDARERMATANLDQLDRALDASNLDAVFGRVTGR